MHLKIDTREVDNGWVLDIEFCGTPPWDSKKGKTEIHEVYEGWGCSMRQRIIDLLEQTVEKLKEGISEKRNPVVE